MKRVAANLFAAVTVCGILFFSSCAKEDDIIPDDPGTEDHSKFLGNWSVSEKSKENGTSKYSVSISDSTNPAYLQIAFLYGLNKQKTYFTVSGNSISIPEQVNSGLKLKGSGTLDNSRQITLNYVVQITSKQFDTVKSILSK